MNTIPITRNMGRMDGWYLCPIRPIRPIPTSYGMEYSDVIHPWFKMYSICGYRVEILPGNLFIIP
jgi:hypothetical protein